MIISFKIIIVIVPLIVVDTIIVIVLPQTAED